MDCSNGEKILVDCGQSQLPIDPTSEIKLKRDTNALVASLREEHFETIPALKRVIILVTHPDSDHFNLIPLIFRTPSSFSIVSVLGGPMGDYFKTDAGKDLVTSLASKGNIVFLSHNLTSTDTDFGNLQSKAEELHDTMKTCKRECPTDATKERCIAQCTSKFEGDIDEYIQTKLNGKVKGHLMDKDLKSFVGSDGRVGRGEFCPAFDIKILSANAGQTPSGVINKYERPFAYSLDSDDNTNSMVLKFTKKDSEQSIILTGDATGVTTDQIIQYYKNSSEEVPDLQTDVMLACHHGADTHNSNDVSWINATRPKATVLSCGRRVDYLHPSCDVAHKYYEVASSCKASDKHFLTCGIRKDAVNPFTEFSSVLGPEGGRGRFIRIEGLDRSVYSTHDSGTMSAVFNERGIDLKRGAPSSDIILVSIPAPSPVPSPSTPLVSRGKVPSSVISSASLRMPLVSPHSAVHDGGDTLDRFVASYQSSMGSRRKEGPYDSTVSSREMTRLIAASTSSPSKRSNVVNGSFRKAVAEALRLANSGLTPSEIMKTTQLTSNQVKFVIDNKEKNSVDKILSLPKWPRA